LDIRQRKDVQIESYHFGDAERLRYGKYPALDAVMSRWARGLEDAMFGTLRQEAYAGASVVEEMRFADFFRSLKRPRPIYLFSLHPYAGQSLLVLDNRFANACLDVSGGKTEHPDRLRLTPENQPQVQRVVQVLLERLESAWADVEPVRAQLAKVTTYLFRARVLNAFDPCLVAQLHLSGDRFSARIMLCLPKYMLTPVLERLQQQPVVPPVSTSGPDTIVTPEQVLGQASYDVTASLGNLFTPLDQRSFQVGSVLPLMRSAAGDVVLEVGGTPLLVGEAGESGGRLAVRVTGAYCPPPRAPSAPPPFQPVEWPVLRT
jgi:flagellar motor switch protein FliM